MERINDKNINTPLYWDTVYNREINEGKLRQNKKLFQLVYEYSRGSVLDIGCGSGMLVLYLIEKKIEAAGVDISNLAISFGQQYNDKLAGKLKVADVNKGLEMGDNSVGTVVSLQTLEHLENPVSAIEEMKRVALNRVIISVPNSDRLKSKEHIWQFTEEDLRELLGKCTIIEVNNGKRLFAYTDTTEA